LLRMRAQVRGVIAAGVAGRAVLVETQPQRFAELCPGGSLRAAHRHALRQRLLVETKGFVVGSGLYVFRPFVVVLAGAAAADNDEAIIVEEQRRATRPQTERAAVAVDVAERLAAFSLRAAQPVGEDAFAVAEADESGDAHVPVVAVVLEHPRGCVLLHL